MDGEKKTIEAGGRDDDDGGAGGPILASPLPVTLPSAT